MSNATSDNRGNGQRRRRSRGGRNRNRQNQGGNREGGAPRGDNRDEGGNRSGRSRDRAPRPKPKPLTWWQKLLKAIGLYKEPTPPARVQKGPAKTNVRNARTEDRESRPPREEREERDDRGPKPERKPRKRREREREDSRGPVSSENVDSKRIYLGNLSYEATESDLEELFRGVGTVRRVEIVYNRKTHRSKGYGFVEMLNVDEAKRSVEILHDQFFMGRKLNVSGAKSEGPVDADDDDYSTDEPAASVAPETPVVEAPAAEEPVAAAPEETPVAEEVPESEEKPRAAE